MDEQKKELQVAVRISKTLAKLSFSPPPEIKSFERNYLPIFFNGGKVRIFIFYKVNYLILFIFRLGGISAGLGRGGVANSQRPNQGCQIEMFFMRIHLCMTPAILRYFVLWIKSLISDRRCLKINKSLHCIAYIRPYTIIVKLKLIQHLQHEWENVFIKLWLEGKFRVQCTLYTPLWLIPVKLTIWWCETTERWNWF